MIANKVDAFPPLVATFALAPPNWIEVVEIEVRNPMPDLDPGETAAIALAELYPGSLLPIDETAGRAEARRRRIAFTGTLGILRDASTAGLVNLRSAIAKLQGTNFRMPTRTMAELLAGDESSTQP
jgi:predicted nucleic acid-binding protein